MTSAVRPPLNREFFVSVTVNHFHVEDNSSDPSLVAVVSDGSVQSSDGTIEQHSIQGLGFTFEQHSIQPLLQQALGSNNNEMH
jgi:hypothetical protein